MLEVAIYLCCLRDVALRVRRSRGDNFGLQWGSFDGLQQARRFPQNGDRVVCSNCGAGTVAGSSGVGAGTAASRFRPESLEGSANSTSLAGKP